MIPRIIIPVCVALTLSCTSGFVPPEPHVTLLPRTRARGRPTIDHLPVGGAGIEEISQIAVPGASSPLVQRAADVVGLNLDINLGAAAAHHAHGVAAGRVVAAVISPLLVAEASLTPPGNAYTATGLFGIAALVLALGAGALVASTVTGKNGLGAFLSQEKDSNPFYQDTMAKYMPKTPGVLNKIRLPDLDFVDVYGQPPAQDEYADLEEDITFDAMASGGAPDEDAVAAAEKLRQKLLMAVQAKDYELASSLERQLANFLRKNGMDFEGDQ